MYFVNQNIFKRIVNEMGMTVRPSLPAAVIGLIALAALGGCETLAVAPKAEDVDPRLRTTLASGKARPVEADLSRTLPIEFVGARLLIHRDKTIATQTGNFNISCSGIGTRRYTAGGLNISRGTLSRFKEAFEDAAVGAGLKVPTVSGSVFVAGRKSAPFHIGAKITDMKLKLCGATSAWDSRYIGMIGAGSLAVTFEVYSVLDARVVYSKTVIGGGRLEQPRKTGAVEIVLRAFGNAATRLARDPGFIRAISARAKGRADVSVDERAPAGQPIRLIGSGTLGGPIVRNMERIRRATVVVSFAGHGSGFLIDRRGYILTNAHVVGNAARVRVKLFEGPSVIGRVVRRDPVRDVALIKIASPGRAPLPLRRLRARVGEEIYVVGAPTAQALEATVSRGIVGGIRRTPNGLIYIQADAAVHPGSSGGPLVDRSGNVVGLTVAALRARGGGLAAGLNLFIPIGDALRRLNLRN